MGMLLSGGPIAGAAAATIDTSFGPESLPRCQPIWSSGCRPGPHSERPLRPGPSDGLLDLFLRRRSGGPVPVAPFRDVLEVASTVAFRFFCVKGRWHVQRRPVIKIPAHLLSLTAHWGRNRTESTHMALLLNLRLPRSHQLHTPETEFSYFPGDAFIDCFLYIGRTANRMAYATFTNLTAVQLLFKRHQLCKQLEMPSFTSTSQPKVEDRR